jgi:hypothetical protein
MLFFEAITSLSGRLGQPASAVDLTFASVLPRALIANVKSKTALEPYIY